VDRMVRALDQDRDQVSRRDAEEAALRGLRVRKVRFVAEASPGPAQKVEADP